MVTRLAPAPPPAWIEGLRLRLSAEPPPAKLTHALQLNDYGLLLRMIADSDAVGLLPARNAGAEPQTCLRRLPVPHVPPPYEMVAAWMRTTTLSPFAQRFLEMLREEIRELPDTPA